MTCRIAIFVLAMVAVGTWGSIESWGAEKGKYRGKAVLYTTDIQEMKIPGKDGQALYQGHDDGIIFAEPGSTLMDKVRYQVVYRGQTNGDSTTYEGTKIFTLADGSMIYADFTGSASGSGGGGTIQLTGGTGKYAKIRGAGTWNYGFITDKLGWDLIDFSYEVP